MERLSAGLDFEPLRLTNLAHLARPKVGSWPASCPDIAWFARSTLTHQLAGYSTPWPVMDTVTGGWAGSVGVMAILAE